MMHLLHRRHLPRVAGKRGKVSTSRVNSRMRATVRHISRFMCGVPSGNGSGHVVHSGRRLMRDPEREAVARYKVESQEMLREHSGLATRLELLDRALARCTKPRRREELRAERVRI